MNSVDLAAPTFQAMMKSLRRLPLVVLCACIVPSAFLPNGAASWAAEGVGGVSGAIALASVFGVIYIQFRKKSVKALIWTQGLQLACALMALLLVAYVMVFEGPFYAKEPLYFLISYPLIAIFAAVYGWRYAVKRWGPRAQWLGEYACSHETVPSNVLYASFFANPVPGSKQKALYWISATVVPTIMLEYIYGTDVMAVPASLGITWVCFLMLSNVLVRSRLVRDSLGKHDLRWVE